MQDNKNPNECPSCPGDDTDLSHGLQCPESSYEHKSSRRLCWNQNHCQKGKSSIQIIANYLHVQVFIHSLQLYIEFM